MKLWLALLESFLGHSAQQCRPSPSVCSVCARSHGDIPFAGTGSYNEPHFINSGIWVSSVPPSPVRGADFVLSSASTHPLAECPILSKHQVLLDSCWFAALSSWDVRQENGQWQAYLSLVSIPDTTKLHPILDPEACWVEDLGNSFSSIPISSCMLLPASPFLQALTSCHHSPRYWG